MASLVVEIEFIQDRAEYEDEKPYILLAEEKEPGMGSRSLTNVEWLSRKVNVQDLRGREQMFELDKTGFQILLHPSMNLNFADIESINRYKRETEKLLMDTLKSSYVFCYDFRVFYNPNRIKLS
ncbi:hypothetical protein BP5796_06483 [Coleophoma crateriformis]|uniref:Uncharacterized protein n=1 Tax=Coleophoma crateriformis TaxID=565419 RepID=A0A3D8RNI6_9HELO|nr:hypothetical protein BP5796_06483 [Coleophoma crateriformis]